MATFPLLGLLVSAVLGVSRAFPGGAPPSTCDTMMPKHRASPQDHGQNPPPYRLTVQNGIDTYTPNQRIEVLLHSIDSSILAKGFLLEARTVADNRIVGHFTDAFKGTKLICDDTAVTQYRTWQVTKTRYHAIWIAPDVEVGDVVFAATVVKTFSVYWTDVRSVILKPYIAPTTTPQPRPVMDQGIAASNLSAVCDDDLLRPLPVERPHVAILCDAGEQCPCGWLCCPSCDGGSCVGHRICRQPRPEQEELEGGMGDDPDASEEDVKAAPETRPEVVRPAEARSSHTRSRDAREEETRTSSRRGSQYRPRGW